MNLLERNIIDAAKRELALLRFAVCDANAAKEFAESAKDLNLSIEETLWIERSIRMNHIDALTGIAELENSGLSDEAEKKLNSIASDCRALHRTALWSAS